LRLGRKTLSWSPPLLLGLFSSTLNKQSYASVNGTHLRVSTSAVLKAQAHKWTA
jgi:hypothetical protein